MTIEWETQGYNKRMIEFQGIIIFGPRNRDA
jgi:hypothetical protein